MQLTKIFSGEQYARALESWAWIDLDGKTPVFTSLFGDVFLRSRDGWWYLDTIEGSLTLVWDSEETMTSALSSEDVQDRYLLAGLALAAAGKGLTLGPNEVYDLVPPPALGGGFEVDNIAIYDFVVAVNLSGQLHNQIRHLPPGTPIAGVRLVEPGQPE